MAVIELFTQRQHRCNIYIQQNILQDAELLEKVFPKRNKLLIVTDEHVAKLYLNQVEQELRPYAEEINHFVLPVGESAKTLRNAEKVIDFLDAHSYGRTDGMVALGGGTVGDSAGFCASVYKRSMNFVQMPTTLLAQVDSSIGGKTALNTDRGKNRIGTFYQPSSVLIDPLFLNSLEKAQFSQGYAEIIKYAAITDAELFDYLKTASHQTIEQNLSWIIERCVKHKARLVTEDELDCGRRRILNFGHAVAHAIESLYGYETYSHGQAVAIGMVVTTKVSEQKGWSEAGSAEEIKELLQKFDLPYQMPPTEAKAVLQALKDDKKTQGSVVKEVILSKIGKARIIDVPFETLEEIITLQGRG